MPYDIIMGRNKEDRERFGEKGLVYLGKGYVKMGNYTSLSNKIFMDVIRSHVVLIAGKRGSGKCLSGDTLITLEDGSQVPIKDLEKNKQRILSLNNKLKIEESDKTEFFSREVNRMIRLKLRSGKEIKLTPEHPLLTIKGWKPVEELRVGSRIATPRVIPGFGEDSMSEHEIKLLSYLIAEGHTKKIVLFSNLDEKIVLDFKDALERFDSSLELVEEKKGHYRISQLNYKTSILEHDLERNKKGQFLKGKGNIVKKRSIREFIEKYGLFGKLAVEKEIPLSIIRLRKEQLALFLNRLFSCDGSIYKSNNYWEISYSSSSRKLIKQVQSLLLRFGILSRLKEKRIKCNRKIFNSFELVLNSENVIKFIDEIGFFGEKEKRELLARNEILLKLKNPNVDTIPKEIWETYKPQNWAKVGRVLGYKHPKAMGERIRYAPSRQTLLNIAEVEQHNPFYLLATSDIFWDEIMAVEVLEGNFKVYDICVPENHNFIANDIIVHNSYSIGVIAEELAKLPEEVKENIAPLIFDTMGIFWTMKYKNDKDMEALEDWELKAENLPVNVWAPSGHFDKYVKRKIPVDKKFALGPNELEVEDWVSIFGLSMIEPASVLIQKVIAKLKSVGDYDLDDVIEEMRNDSEATDEVKKSGVALFEAAKSWKIFANKNEKSTKIRDLVVPGKTSVLDLSIYSSTSAFNVRALVIGLISRKLFNQRVLARKQEEMESIYHGVTKGKGSKAQKEMPIVWLFIDEAHEFLPNEGKTPATNSLIQVLREGRQPGISIVLATQQPGVIHRDVMTQSDLVLAHRLTNKNDIEALNEIMQTYMLATVQKEMRELPDLKGSGIVLDDNSERLYPVRIRPRLTWHGGEAPIALVEGD